jgi:hypothetical protein
MMADTLYLEVDKSNGAILSYSVTKLESKTSDFIEATEAELDYLNRLEANVLPAGQVTTLSDLNDYRAKVKKIDLLKFQLAQNEGKIARLELQIAQDKGKAAQAQIKVAQAKAQLDATQAKKDALLSAGAAKHGVTPAEYEAEMIAQYKASQAGTAAPQAKSSKVRSDTLKQMQRHWATKGRR